MPSGTFGKTAVSRTGAQDPTTESPPTAERRSRQAAFVNSLLAELTDCAAASVSSAAQGVGPANLVYASAAPPVAPFLST